MSNLVERTVRNGKVKINGVWYMPDDSSFAYDGRLDGVRCLFGLYPNYYSTGIFYECHIELWGTVAYSQWHREQCEKYNGEFFEDCPPDIQLDVVDNVFVWSSWYADKSHIIDTINNDNVPFDIRWRYAVHMQHTHDDKSYVERFRAMDTWKD